MLYLGGGGSADEESRVWDLAFKPGQRVAIWPFAKARDRWSSTKEWIRSELRHRGDFAVFINDEGPTYGLADADILVIPGGNTFDLLAHVRSHGMGQLLREFLGRGGKLYGGSAGAVLLGKDIDIVNSALGPGTDPNDAKVEDTAALDLLGGTVVFPHYNAKSETHRIHCQRWADQHNVTVACIEEQGGIAVDADGIAYNPGPANIVLCNPRTKPLIVRAGEVWLLREPMNCWMHNPLSNLARRSTSSNRANFPYK